METVVHGIERMNGFILIFKYNSPILQVYLGAFDHSSQVSFLIHLANTTCNRTIFRDRFLKFKTDHAILPGCLRRSLRQKMIHNFIRFPAIVVIRIDNSKRFMDNIFRHQHGMGSSPWLDPVLRYLKSFWEPVQ